VPWRVALRALPPFAVLALVLTAGVCAAGAAGQRVSFRTDDGVVLSGAWYEPAGRPAPAVILVHMLNRSRREWDAAGQRFASAGIGALAFDLRGHGDSGGAVAASDPARPDYSALVLDVRAARRYVAQRADVDASRIGLVGASLGANLAALEASADPSVTALALLSPSLDYRGLRIEAAVRKLADRRILLVAGDDDPYAMRSVRELQRDAAPSAELRVVGRGGHGTMMLAHDPALLPALVDWFRRTLL
jgi:dienelactone hydrolase